MDLHPAILLPAPHACFAAATSHRCTTLKSLCQSRVTQNNGMLVKPAQMGAHHGHRYLRCRCVLAQGQVEVVLMKRQSFNEMAFRFSFKTADVVTAIGRIGRPVARDNAVQHRLIDVEDLLITVRHSQTIKHLLRSSLPVRCITTGSRCRDRHAGTITISALMKRSFALALLLMTVAPSSLAHSARPRPEHAAVIPEAEQQAAHGMAPSETRNVAALDLGALDLSKEFRALEGRVLRARLITIDPGGSVAWHEHQQRPGVAYLLRGTLLEIRDEGDGQSTIVRRPGDAVFESTGVRHGWTNADSVPATALVIDLIPER